ncbi:MAG: B-box zinc finger protein [Chloroflexi bacterium]|nr:B-box zinc finger protein [Chloroflexota bacterium]MCY4247234.1 B-box zinc finger protein [Chloroflexota bacterium]
MAQSISDAASQDKLTYCARHPERDTGLRCNRCDRYMCVECAVRTPIGYTCRECVRGHEDKFYAGTLTDYGLVGAVGLAGGAATVLLAMLAGGFFIVGLLLAPALGGALAQFALQLTGRRRGRHSGLACAGGVIAGGLLGSLAVLGGVGLFSLLYLGLAASAAYTRFKVSI